MPFEGKLPRHSFYISERIPGLIFKGDNNTYDKNNTEVIYNNKTICRINNRSVKDFEKDFDALITKYSS